MITTTIDSVIRSVADLRNELRNLDYSEEAYDIKENRLHDLEDKMLHDHGEALYSILKQVYEENGILPPFLTPLAYIPRSLIKKVNNRYDVEPKAGAVVDIKDEKGPYYLSLVPGPLRLVLQDASGNKKVIWKSDS